MTNDNKIEVCEIASDVEISSAQVHNNFHQNLNVKKLKGTAIVYSLQ